jgi:CheY-like chemotaxis protein
MREAGELAGLTIMVIEDDFVIGEAVAAVLAEAGATIIGPIGWVGDAIDAIANLDAPFDAALLDIHLHGEMSYPVADELIRRCIGFVFVTGYSADAIDPAYRKHRRFEKPARMGDVISALAEAKHSAVRRHLEELKHLN